MARLRDVSSLRRGLHRRSGAVGYERPFFAYLLNAPSLLAVLLLAAYPIVYSAWISLHKYSLKRPRVFDFVGFSNYLQILQSQEFWSALVVTLVVILGLAIAILLNRRFPGCGLLRGLILLPWAIPPVVNGLMWQWIYDSNVGALNGLLLSLGLIGEYRGWLSDPTSALIALVSADVWNTVPLAV